MFWIEGTTVSVDRIEAGVRAAQHMCWQNNINPHKAYLANEAKKCGEPYSKTMAAAWKLARNECFNACFGECCCWERGAKFIFK